MFFVFSFQNFEKVKVLIKLSAVQCNFQTEMQLMTEQKLIKNGLNTPIILVSSRSKCSP